MLSRQNWFNEDDGTEIVNSFSCEIFQARQFVSMNSVTFLISVFQPTILAHAILVSL